MWKFTNKGDINENSFSSVLYIIDDWKNVTKLILLSWWNKIPLICWSPVGCFAASESLHGAFRDTCSKLNLNVVNVVCCLVPAIAVVVVYMRGLEVHLALLAENTIFKKSKRNGPLKGKKNRRCWMAPSRARPLVLLRSSVAKQRFSCVIIKPTYDHEREGRGNFVREGKSGELASPPSFTQHAHACCCCCCCCRRRAHDRRLSTRAAVAAPAGLRPLTDGTHAYLYGAVHHGSLRLVLSLI